MGISFKSRYTDSTLYKMSMHPRNCFLSGTKLSLTVTKQLLKEAMESETELDLYGTLSSATDMRILNQKW